MIFLSIYTFTYPMINFTILNRYYQIIVCIFTNKINNPDFFRAAY